MANKEEEEETPPPGMWETLRDAAYRAISKGGSVAPKPGTRPSPTAKGSKAPPPLSALSIPSPTVKGPKGVVQKKTAPPPPKFGWTPPKDPDAVITRHDSSPQKSETDSAIEAFLKKFYGKDGSSGMVDIPPSAGKEYKTAVEDGLANSLEHRYKNLSEEEGLEGDALEQAAYDASAYDFDNMVNLRAREDNWKGSGYTLYQMEDSKGESRFFIDTPNGYLSTDVIPPIGGLAPEESRDEVHQRIAERINQGIEDAVESGRNWTPPEAFWDTTGLE